jgi:tetratricopeptide (TPR) repeat protein
VEQDPKYADAYLQIGLLLKQKGDKLAQKYLDNAVKANPKAEDALYAKGFAEKDAKQYEQAIATFKQVVELNHRNPDALDAIGFCYLQQDSFQTAYRYFNLAISIDPEFAEAFYRKGLCAEKLNRKEEAKSLYQQSLNLNPKLDLATASLKRMEK